MGGVLAVNHLRVPQESVSLESLAQQLFVALWVYVDRQGRQLRLPYEFDAFVFLPGRLLFPIISLSLVGFAESCWPLCFLPC